MIIYHLISKYRKLIESLDVTSDSSDKHLYATNVFIESLKLLCMFIETWPLYKQPAQNSKTKFNFNDLWETDFKFKIWLLV